MPTPTAASRTDGGSLRRLASGWLRPTMTNKPAITSRISAVSSMCYESPGFHRSNSFERLFAIVSGRGRSFCTHFVAIDLTLPGKLRCSWTTGDVSGWSCWPRRLGTRTGQGREGRGDGFEWLGAGLDPDDKLEDRRADHQRRTEQIPEIDRIAFAGAALMVGA